MFSLLNKNVNHVDGLHNLNSKTKMILCLQKFYKNKKKSVWDITPLTYIIDNNINEMSEWKKTFL